MPVCTSCNIEYEEDKKFCNYCGGALTPKSEPMSAPKKANRADEEKSDGKLFCPQCKITYEFGSSCIQCGSPLGRQASQEKDEPTDARGTPYEEKLPPVETSEKQKSGTSPGKLICPTCKIIYEHGTSCIKCESALVPQTSVQASGAPEVSNGSKIEENHVQIQTIEEQLAPEKVVETPRTKLICPSCKIIYERGSSCVRCGAALVSQTPPKEKEKSKSSDAGSNLSPSESEVLEAAFGVTFRKGTEESKSPEIEPKPSPSESDGLGDLFLRRVAPDLSEASDRKPGVASKQPSPSGPKGQDVGAPERGKKKGPRVTPTPELSLEEEFLQAQSPEQPVAKKSVGDLLKSGTFLDKLKKDYRRLGLEVGSIVIMVVAGGYLLWSVYSYLAKPKQPEPGAPVSKNAAVQSLPKSSSSTPPTPAAAESGESKKTEGSSSISGSSVSKDAASAPPAPSLPDAAKTRSAESQDKENIKTVFENEIRNIKTLLENVRQSNLKKDIDLFVSCYSSDFENMEGRKRATIAYWEKFNYLDLSYDLKDLSLSAETAKARVEWLIKTSSRNGDQAQQNKSVLDVAFKKEGGKWRIREVKPAK